MGIVNVFLLEKFVSRHIPPDDEDLVFFRHAMKDVRRIKQRPMVKRSPMATNARLDSSNQSVVRNCSAYETDKELDLSLKDPAEQTITVKAEDALFFRRQGPQNKVIQQLVRGKIVCSACLDLHGMTIQQARLATISFLIECRKSHFRCIKIIHGKGHLSHGGAKLKNHINYWLPQIPWILAFSSAQSKDGGRGAVYVLLAKLKL